MSENASSSVFEQAKNLIVTEQAVSVSLLQRHLRMGYSAALKLMDDLERVGVVTPLNDEGHRQLTTPYRTL